ncbi:MAG: mechanosensitive ion channel family protein [Methanomassiliicoccales archaeon]|jgi:small-conductance mechanosensitive channel|nr:mechanosensitive ion channel family protein [Methanomassiliicoccales archaeon]
MDICDMSPTLEIGNTSWLEEYGWAILAFFSLFVLSLYLWSYVSKHFEKMKTKESKYFDADVVEFLGRTIKSLIVIFLIFSLIYVTSFVSEFFRENIWNFYSGYMIEIIFIIVLLLLAILVGKILRRISKSARVRSLKDGTIHTSAVEFTTLFLSYVLYVIVAIIILFVLISMIPGVDPYTGLAVFLERNQVALVSTFIIILAIYLIVKLIEAIFEDYKFRTKRFNPQAIDLFKVSLKYALYLVAAFTAIFNFFALIELELVGFLLVAILFTFIIIGIIFSYSTARNIVSGFTIMEVNLFDVGDYIKIGDSLECEVLEKGIVYTKVRTPMGEIIDIPNQEILRNRIYNYSRSGTYGISLVFEVSTDVPYEKVESLVKSAAANVSGIVEKRLPEVTALEINNDKIKYEVVVFTNAPTECRRIRSDFITHLLETFRKNGVNIA